MNDNLFTEIEDQIIATSKLLVVQLRGNQAGNGNAIIDLDLIFRLHELLELYKTQITHLQFVNKDVVGLLFYTCTRFYVQSKYSKNSAELIEQFDKMYLIIMQLYMTNV